MSVRKYTTTRFNFKSLLQYFTQNAILKITWQYITQENQLIVVSSFLSYLAVVTTLC